MDITIIHIDTQNIKSNISHSLYTVSYTHLTLPTKA